MGRYPQIYGLAIGKWPLEIDGFGGYPIKNGDFPYSRCGHLKLLRGWISALILKKRSP